MVLSFFSESEACTSFYACLAFGKRLVSAGRRFQSMGQYGQGELQKVLHRTLKLILCFHYCYHIITTQNVYSKSFCSGYSMWDKNQLPY
jgi:hypothetical protein